MQNYAFSSAIGLQTCGAAHFFLTCPRPTRYLAALDGANILALLTHPYLNLFEYQKGKAEIENVVDNFDYYKKKQKLQEEMRNKQRFRR